MKKIVLTFGLISGLIMSAVLVLTIPLQDRIDLDKGEIVGYATMVAASLLIYFGVRRYRDDVAGGSVSFGRALAVGALIAAVAGVCYTVTWEIILARTGSTFVAKYQAAEMEKVRARGATETEAAKRVQQAHEAEMYRNPLISSAITFLEPLPVTLVVTLISALALRRRGSRAEGSSDLARAV